MFISNHLKVSLLLATAILTLQVGEAQSGLFDWRPFQRKSAPLQDGASASSSAPITQAGAFEPVAEPAAAAQSGTAGTFYPMTSFHESACSSEPAMKTCCDKSFRCFNCGEDDKCSSCLRNCRKKCKQTWYPRVAPYCQTGWGWTQPCWRRTQDNYNCPRTPELPLTSPLPAVAPEAAEPEGVPETPALSRQSAARR